MGIKWRRTPVPVWEGGLGGEKEGGVWMFVKGLEGRFWGKRNIRIGEGGVVAAGIFKREFPLPAPRKDRIKGQGNLWGICVSCVEVRRRDFNWLKKGANVYALGVLGGKDRGCFECAQNAGGFF